ncbi:MAG: hypothetical protein ACKPIH_24625 [Microcystis panniformis]
MRRAANNVALNLWAVDRMIEMAVMLGTINPQQARSIRLTTFGGLATVTAGTVGYISKQAYNSIKALLPQISDTVYKKRKHETTGTTFQFAS